MNEAQPALEEPLHLHDEARACHSALHDLLHELTRRDERTKPRGPLAARSPVEPGGLWNRVPGPDVLAMCGDFARG